MDCRTNLEEYLRQNQVAFQVQHHPLAFTAQEVAGREHVPGRLMAKTVMVIADGKLAMLVLCAPHQVNLAKAKAALGVDKLRLAHESEFASTFTDCDVGAMPPFGNLYGVPMWVDRRLAEDEIFYFRAGTHTDTMSLRYEDYARLVQPQLADLADSAG